MPTPPLNDADKRSRLAAGQPLFFDPIGTDQEESGESRTARTIDADWLRDLIKPRNNAVRAPIRIRNAIIRGDFDVSYASFERDLVIEDSEFLGSVSLRAAIFKTRFSFSGSRFHGPVDFCEAQAKSDLEIHDAYFCSTAFFMDASIEQNLGGSGATFGEATFDRISVRKGLFFNEGTGGRCAGFNGPVRFHSAVVSGFAVFRGARFEDVAIFDNFRADGGLVFGVGEGGKAATFGGLTRFNNARCNSAEFVGVRFDKDARFDGFMTEKNATFGLPHPGPDSPRTVFGSDAVFLNAQIGGQAIFVDATFVGSAKFAGAQFGAEAVFNGSRFQGLANFDRVFCAGALFFDQGTHVARFHQEARFCTAHFKSDVVFAGAHFEGLARFDNSRFSAPVDFRYVVFSQQNLASFSGTNFEHAVAFRGSRFQGDTGFVSTYVEREAFFEGAIFERAVSFHQARFGRAVFRAEVTGTHAGATAPQFLGPVDMMGFTYERIYVALPELIEKLSPFDIQTFSQMEEVLRRMGRGRSARQVHRAGERRTTTENFANRRYFSFLLNLLYWLVDYGLPSFRSIAAPLVLLVLAGVFVFSRPGAVISGTNAPILAIAETVGHDLPAAHRLSFSDAFRLTVRLTSPVEIPVAEDLVPSRRAYCGLRFSDIAASMKILSWAFIVYLGALFKGFLRRSS